MQNIRQPKQPFLNKAPAHLQYCKKGLYCPRSVSEMVYGRGGGNKGMNFALMLIAGSMFGLLALAAIFVFGGAGTGGSLAQMQGAEAVPAGTMDLTCTGNPGVAQAVSVLAVDKDNQGTGVTTTSLKNFLDTSTGQLNPGNLSTQYGKTYTLWGQASGYLSGIQTYRTSCNEPTPQIQLPLKAYDTAINFTILNANGVTPNTASARQAISSTAPSDVTIAFRPSAKNKYIGGTDASVGGSGQAGYLAWVNVTTNATLNQSDYAAGQFTLTGLNGAGCAQTTLPAIPSGANTVLQAFTCYGDFPGDNVKSIDTNLHMESVTDPVTSTVGFCVVGLDYFQQVNAQIGKAKGSLQIGGIKDDGSAIQTAQCANIFMS